MRGTKCLEPLEISRLLSCLVWEDSYNSPVEGLLPNCTLCFHCQSHGSLSRPVSALAVFPCLHLSERDTSRRKVRIVLDHIRQLSRRFPSHLAGDIGAQGPKALAGTTGGRGGGASGTRQACGLAVGNGSRQIDDRKNSTDG